MVLSTDKELIFSKKQHQILAQTAYYQAGKIVIQTILPEQPPVALITLNTLGTTCSTSADTYIPIENISNTQSCSFLESRLVSLYGGKAASLLIEYQQGFSLLTSEAELLCSCEAACKEKKQKRAFNQPLLRCTCFECSAKMNSHSNHSKHAKHSTGAFARSYPSSQLSRARRYAKASPSKFLRTKLRTDTSKLIDNTQNGVLDPFAFTPLQNKKLRAKFFAGAGNNIFQSTLGNIEIRIATQLARIMVNYWNFYSLNKTSLKTSASFLKVQQLKVNNTKLVNTAEKQRSSASSAVLRKQDATLRLAAKIKHAKQTSEKGKALLSFARQGYTKPLGLMKQPEYNVKVWGIKLKVKDKTPKEKKKLYFAITQSKNSLKICENKNFSYSIRRLSVENIGDYSPFNTNNFQLINSLQFSNLQRDRFYPNWFRLYLPDIEATEFLKNVANYYFSLGLQTLTLPSTKSYSELLTHYPSASCAKQVKVTGYGKVRSKALPCIPASLLCVQNCTCKAKRVKSKARTTFAKRRSTGLLCVQSCTCIACEAKIGKFIPNITSCTELLPSKELEVPSFTKKKKNAKDVPFSLLLENQIFPLNYNGFSIVEKELLYNALVNSCFAKAFYLINQNRQLLDFWVDYLLRFQILRQHQILYLFSTLLVKKAVANF